MKLNPDCVRDILLVIEEQSNFEASVDFDCRNLHGLEQNYTYDEVIYHLRQCKWSGFFSKSAFDALDGFCVEDLSPKGHEFIENIRKDTVWNGVKSVAGKVGATSLSALVQISSNVVSELIKSYFTLNPYQPNV